MFRKINSLKFLDIVKFKGLQIVYRAYHNNLPTNLQSYFMLNRGTVSYDMRSRDKFKIKYVRTSLRSKLVSIIGPKLWNQLPQSIRECVNIESFKKALKYFLITSYV